MFGLKLFLVIYNAAGLVAGTGGPIPVHRNCLYYVLQSSEKMRTRPDLQQLTFACEWHRKRPKLQAK